MESEVKIRVKADLHLFWLVLRCHQPVQAVPHLYGEDLPDVSIFSLFFCNNVSIINKYRDIFLTTISDVANPRYIGKRRNEVPPHLFAASDGAYAQMMNNTKDQVK